MNEKKVSNSCAVENAVRNFLFQNHHFVCIRAATKTKLNRNKT